MAETPDSTKETFLEWNLITFQVEKPISNEIIVIDKMPPLPEPTDLPDEILSILGVQKKDAKKEESSLFNFGNIFSCGVCKAQSK